jgi:O-methyltransferase
LERRMIKKLIRSAIVKPFNLIGYDVSFSKIGTSSISIVDKYIWEPFFSPNHEMRLYFEGLKKSRMEWSDNFYKQLRFYSLQQMVHYVLRSGKLSNDFVECGVLKGHSAFIISSILAEHEFTGEFHIFDSFEGGLSGKVEKDKNLRHELSEKEIQKESDMFFSTEDEVRSCLNDFKFIRLYKGWIPNRFSEVGDRQFSFVHIDVDLYEPTLDSLDFFYQRLVENGVIVCDDYGVTQFPGPKRAVDEFLEKNSYKMFYEVPMGACFIIK